MADLVDRARRGEKARLTDTMPVWVSNKDADGMIYQLSIPMWAHLALAISLQLWVVITLLAALGIIGWGVVTAVAFVLAFL